MKRRFFGFVVLIVMFSFLVSAGVDLDEGSIVIKDYRVGDFLQGTLKINITGESVEEEFRFVFEDIETQIEVKDFLDVYDEEIVSYVCDPVGCGNNFEVDGDSETSKSFSLSSGNGRTIGFVLNGNNVEVLENGLSFDVASDSQANCLSQLSIDVSGDGNADWENSKSISGESCGVDKRSECYESFDSWFLLDEVPYCEKIEIGKAPSFEIKANMKKNSAESSFDGKPLIARIYGPDKIEKGECELSQPTLDGSVESCEIDYISKSEEDHFVCISTREGSNNLDYSLKARDSGSFCGFLGDPEQVSATTGDYDIVVSPKKYDAVGTFSFDDVAITEQTGSPLVSLVNSYLSSRYGKDCSDECIIPIGFSGLSQEIIINNIDLKYKHSASNQISKDSVALLSETPAILDSEGFLTLDLSENEISLPSSPGDYTFELFFNGNKILEENITISEKEKTLIDQIHPRVVAAAIVSRFIVFVDSELNVSALNFKWDFGGGVVRSSKVPYVDYVFPAIGDYEVGVSVFEGNEELSSRVFSVSAKSPVDVVSDVLVEYKSRLEKLGTQRSGLSASHQTALDGVVNINDIDSRIKGIEARYLALTASDDTDGEVFVGIINELFSERVPRSINPSSTSDVKFLYQFNDLDLDDFSLIFGQNYLTSQEQEYKEAIFKWFVENVDSRIKHKTYSVYYDDSREGFVSDFEVSIDPLTTLSGKGYLIIERDIEEITFESGHTPLARGDVVGVEVDLSQLDTVKFSLEEDVDVFSLPMYFSPSFDKLSVSSGVGSTTDKSGLGSTAKFLFGLFAVLFVVFVMYFFLQRWYKNNYERSLFKSRNDLYNLLAFIKNSKAKKLSDSQIRQKLSKAKWKREQVTYALNKFSGKRVGMWEIPLFKGIEKKKMERELSKRKRVARI